MKRLKLIQDELDIDFVHVYAPHGNRFLRACTVHVDALEDIFPKDIADHFQEAGAESWLVEFEILEQE